MGEQTAVDIRTVSQAISAAMKQKLNGQSRHYALLVQQLRTANDAMLCKLFRALTRNISDIGRDPSACDELTTAAFAVRVRVGQPGASNAQAAVTTLPSAEAFCNFAVGLVGVNGVFFHPVARAIVRNLVLNAADEQDDAPEARQLHRLFYGALCKMVELVPTGGGALFCVLAEYFPHKRMSLAVHRSYARHLFRIAELIPGLRDRVVASLVDRLVEIDVDISIDDLNDEEGGDVTPGAPPVAVELASKLDALCLLAFRYLHAGMCGCGATGQATLDAVLDTDAAPSCEASTRVGADSGDVTADPASRDHLFTLVLGVFERSVLMAHRSKFTQFLVFYACSLDPAFVDRFIARLLRQLCNPDRPPLNRITHAAYLGSFLARASYLRDSTLRSALVYMLQYCHAYLDLHGLRTAGRSVDDVTLLGSPLPQLAPEAVFYAVVQSAFYVICFQASAFRGRAGGVEFLQSLRCGRLIASELDPLKHCLTSVAAEFLRVAHVLRLVSHADLSRSAVYQRLTSQRSDDSDLIAHAMDGGLDDNVNVNPLGSFFPFDPFLLRHSSRYIAGIYRTWNSSILGEEVLGDWSETDGYDTQVSGPRGASNRDSSAVSSSEGGDTESEAASEDEDATAALPVASPAQSTVTARMRMSLGLDAAGAGVTSSRLDAMMATAALNDDEAIDGLDIDISDVPIGTEFADDQARLTGSVSRLDSKMRGLSFDEWTYYASVNAGISSDTAGGPLSFVSAPAAQPPAGQRPVLPQYAHRPPHHAVRPSRSRSDSSVSGIRDDEAVMSHKRPRDPSSSSPSTAALSASPLSPAKFKLGVTATSQAGSPSMAVGIDTLSGDQLPPSILAASGLVRHSTNGAMGALSEADHRAKQAVKSSSPPALRAELAPKATTESDGLSSPASSQKPSPTVQTAYDTARSRSSASDASTDTSYIGAPPPVKMTRAAASKLVPPSPAGSTQSNGEGVPSWDEFEVLMNQAADHLTVPRTPQALAKPVTPSDLGIVPPSRSSSSSKRVPIDSVATSAALKSSKLSDAGMLSMSKRKVKRGRVAAPQSFL